MFYKNNNALFNFKNTSKFIKNQSGTLVLVFGDDKEFNDWKEDQENFISNANSNTCFLNFIPSFNCYVQQGKFLNLKNVNNLSIMIYAHAKKDNQNWIFSHNLKSKINWQSITTSLIQLIEMLNPNNIMLQLKICHALHPLTNIVTSLAYKIYRNLLFDMILNKIKISCVATANIYVTFQYGKSIIEFATTHNYSSDDNKKYLELIKSFKNNNSPCFRNRLRERLNKFGEKQAHQKFKNKKPLYFLTYMIKKIKGTLCYQPAIIDMQTRKPQKLGPLLYRNDLKNTMCEVPNKKIQIPTTDFNQHFNWSSNFPPLYKPLGKTLKLS
ncbi:MAG: hypothetical protein PVI75_08350 [Gammaproteobacteria bacterium]|jgi:hypothetical protein